MKRPNKYLGQSENTQKRSTGIHDPYLSFRLQAYIDALEKAQTITDSKHRKTMRTKEHLGRVISNLLHNGKIASWTDI